MSIPATGPVAAARHFVKQMTALDTGVPILMIGTSDRFMQ
jgi:hypothetical protein